MAPTYHDGDRLLVRRGERPPARGAVVVFRIPAEVGRTELDWLVKRVVAVPGDPVPPDVRGAAGGALVVPPGRLVVRGDNPRSVDSRRFGFIPVADVLGVAARRLDHLDI
jgi:type IV secretory pathway protease TraF